MCVTDLNKSIKHFQAYILADNTNILQSSEALVVLAKKNEPRYQMSFTKARN